MNNGIELIFDDEFINLFDKAEKEAERLNLKFVSIFFMLNTIVKNPDTFLSEFLKFAGLNRGKVESAMLTQMKCYLKDIQQIETNTFTCKITIDEIEVKGNLELLQTLMASTAFSSTGETINEISFIMEVMCNIENEYINNFFEEIGINKMLVIRYFEGLAIESKFEECQAEYKQYYS